ncbi:MAG TPA: hypothetical protein VEN79_11245, partial [Terriglobia bacterium]|nr:hypothetical protein [Terriglobia bacterium]
MPNAAGKWLLPPIKRMVQERALENPAQHVTLAGCGKTVRNSPEATALIPGGDRFTSRGQRPRKAFP